jgi:hypothetical protein
MEQINFGLRFQDTKDSSPHKFHLTNCREKFKKETRLTKEIRN